MPLTLPTCVGAKTREGANIGEFTWYREKGREKSARDESSDFSMQSFAVIFEWSLAVWSKENAATAVSKQSQGQGCRSEPPV